MNLRHYFLIYVALYGAGAIFTLVLAASVGEGLGLLALLGLALYFGYRSTRTLKSFRMTGKGERLETPLADGTPEERLATLKGIAPWFFGALVVLSLMTALELYSLAIGKQAQASVVFPVGFIYGKLGFWPAVLTLPSIGFVLGIAMIWKARQLGRECANNFDADKNNNDATTSSSRS